MPFWPLLSVQFILAFPIDRRAQPRHLSTASASANSRVLQRRCCYDPLPPLTLAKADMPTVMSPSPYCGGGACLVIMSGRDGDGI
ncbi:hypothetical protein Mapa_010627 [Marchantia paleacea]|nr:hypothetical protein Mapa_010627 [Marchantia paleacea]